MVAIRNAILTEPNNASSVTNATGSGSVKVTKLSMLEDAQVFNKYYEIETLNVSGNTINYQVWQGGSAGGQRVQPTSAVTFSPGDLKILEIGN